MMSSACEEENDIENPLDSISEVISVINLFNDNDERSTDVFISNEVGGDSPKHAFKSSNDNEDKKVVEVSATADVSGVISQDQNAKSLNDNIKERESTSTLPNADRESSDMTMKVSDNDKEQNAVVSPINEPDEPPQGHDLESSDNNEADKCDEDVNADADDEASMDCDTRPCNGNGSANIVEDVFEVGATEQNIPDQVYELISDDVEKNDVSLDDAVQNAPDEHESLLCNEEDMVVDATPNIAVVMVQSLRPDYDPELFKDKEGENTDTPSMDDLVDKVTSDHNTTSPNENDSQNAEIPAASFDYDSESSKDNELENTINDAVHTVFQDSDIVSTTVNDSENVENMPQNDTENKIFEDKVSESSEDEFSKDIEDALEDNFIENDDEEIKIIDAPVAKSPQEYVSISSDDEDLEKAIQDAVKEFQEDTSASVDSETGKSAPSINTNEDPSSEISPHHIEFEMSIEVDDPKIKVECISPEPCLPTPQDSESTLSAAEGRSTVDPDSEVTLSAAEGRTSMNSESTLSLQDTATPETSSESSASGELTPGNFTHRNNWEGKHSFTITVSYFDSENPNQCAVYSVQENKLYISKDREFQILCIVNNAPQGSVVRACLFYTSSFEEASQVVQRCSEHLKSDMLTGKSPAEHVLQSLNADATYEKSAENGRFSVLNPFPSESFVYSVQDTSQRSCYKYQFTCLSSCNEINNRDMAIRFTLENDGVVLGRQVLDVKVSETPEKDWKAESAELKSSSKRDVWDAAQGHLKNGAVGKGPHLIDGFIVPALDAQTYGDKMYWDENIRGAFLIKWTHKAKNGWCTDESSVFTGFSKKRKHGSKQGNEHLHWDRKKHRPDPVGDQELVDSKQRFRAALRNHTTINEIHCDLVGYKKYAITNLKQIKRNFHKNIHRIPKVQIPDKTYRPNVQIPDKTYRPNVQIPDKTYRPTNPIAAKIDTPERLPRLVKLETPTYEEMGEDDDPEYQTPESPKRKKVSPPKSFKRRKASIFGKKKRPRPKPNISVSEITRPLAMPTDCKKPVPKPKSSGTKTSLKSVKPTSVSEVKGQDFLPKVRLTKLTLEDILNAGVVMEENEKKILQHMLGTKNQEVVPKSKPSPKQKSTSTKSKPTKTKTKPKAQPNPKRQKVMEEKKTILAPPQLNPAMCERLKFEAAPLMFPTTPSPTLMPMQEAKDEIPKTFENIKTQSDMILVMIKTVLPNIPGEKVNEIYQYLVDLGVENANDLAFIEEDDLNKVVKPIQSRKLLAAWKNKGVPGSVLPKRASPSEPVTFVPAVFQINNMPPQNRITPNHQIYPPDSSVPHPCADMQQLNIPGWSRSTVPARPNQVTQNRQVFSPDTATSHQNPDMPHMNIPVWSSNQISQNQNRQVFSPDPVASQNRQVFSSDPVASHPSPNEQSVHMQGWGHSNVSAMPGQVTENRPVVKHVPVIVKGQGTERQQMNMPGWSRSLLMSNQGPQNRQSTDMPGIPGWSRSPNPETPQGFGFAVPSGQATNSWSPSMSQSQYRDSSNIVSYSKATNSGKEWGQSPSLSILQKMYTDSTASYNTTLGTEMNSNATVNPETVSKSKDSKKKTASTKPQKKRNPKSKGATSKSKSLDSSSNSGEWVDSFEIPWHIVPARITSCFENNRKLSHTYRLLLIRIICSEIFKVNCNPTPEDLEVIAKKMCEKYPTYLCDVDGGQVLLNEYGSLLQQLMNRVEKMKLESFQDPDLSEEENRRRWKSECAGNTSLLRTTLECSQEADESAEHSSSDVSQTATNCGLEDFNIPLHKLPSDIVNSLSLKKRLSGNDRKELIRVLCDEVFGFLQQVPTIADMQIISCKIYQQFPGFHCEGGMTEKRFASQLQARIRYLFERAGKTGTGRRASHSDLEDCAEVAVTTPGLSRSIHVDDPDIPSPWAISFRIPWEELSANLLQCLENKVRLTPIQTMDLVCLICTSMLKVHTNPANKDIKFIAQKACDEYPMSLCYSFSGEVVGSEVLSGQMLMRIGNVCRVKHQEIEEGLPLKKPKLEPTQRYDAEDLVVLQNS